jgi:hypothetical protein
MKWSRYKRGDLRVRWWFAILPYSNEDVTYWWEWLEIKERRDWDPVLGWHWTQVSVRSVDEIKKDDEGRG